MLDLEKLLWEIRVQKIMAGFKALLAMVMGLVFCLVAVFGCQGGQTITVTGEAPKPPAGCENSQLWKHGFMPLGPGLVVAGVSTALIAEPKAAPAIRLACAAAYRTVGTGSLAEVNGALRENNIGKYFVPVLTLFDQWSKQGAVQGAEIKLDACDRQILKDMIRDVALTAGASPGDFQ